MRTAERPRFSPESKRVVVPKAFGTPQNDRFRSGQGESHPGRIFRVARAQTQPPDDKNDESMAKDRTGSPRRGSIPASVVRSCSVE